jgi:hypothetical protein
VLAVPPLGFLAISANLRETSTVVVPGASRQWLARTLNAAYADGLLSEGTLSHRLDLLFGSELIDPSRLIGDLYRRAPGRERPAPLWRTLRAFTRKLRAGRRPPDPTTLLALDWSGGHDELIVGRHLSCDVVLSRGGVSRRHARLIFRDGTWVLQDLESTNGTKVNGVAVGRCQLRPGDHLVFGDQHVRID